MEKIKWDTLLKCRKAFIDDVDVFNGIIHPLKSEYILKHDDVLEIMRGKTKEERATILLDILPRCGPFAFDILNQALKHHYGWLSEFMERNLEKETGMLTNDTGYFIDLPPVPPLSVTRDEKVNEFKQDLRKLEPGKHLALHGLKGFGKSCLTVITLKDRELVSELFENKIYWLKFSYTSKKLGRGLPVDENKINEEILSELNELYQKIKKSDTLPTPLKLEPLQECFIRLIKLHFSQRQNQNSLLILDDVCNEKIVDTFNFGCKTLVITDDLSVVKHKHPKTFEILDGFSEAESLGLFAKVLDVPVESLPPEAKKIHEECKGMPLLISMFSAQFEDFKDQMIDNRERWKYYLRTLRKGDPENRAIQKRTAIFDMCIEKLVPDLKDLYYELAIFSEDVNIMPKTLEILWGVEPFEVDEKMLIFCHKSLAARRWNEEVKSYVYGVHDLLLSHLKMKLTPKKLKEKHQSFIKKYQQACKGDFSKLPDDNYSFSYIGHHLEQAELYNLFEKVYLNLEFVQAKIIKAGLSDLLIDLEKYKEHITRNSEELETKRSDLEKFLKSQMSVLTKYGIRNCLDVIQIALNHEEKGFVLNESHKLADKRTSDLYFSNQRSFANGGISSAGNVSTESTVDSFVEDISAIAFTDEPNSLLLASKNGDIILKNVVTKKSHYFSGFQGKNIIKLVLSHVDNYFLALTDEGKAKLFCINEEENTNGNMDRNPREKQKIWTGVFTGKSTEDNSLHSFSIEGDKLLDIAFSQDDHFIAGCSPKGIIKVWKLNGEVVQSVELSYTISLKKIAFTSDLQKNNLMHVVGGNECVITTYRLYNNIFQYKTQYNPKIKLHSEEAKIVLFKRLPQENNSVILVTEKKVAYIKWLQSDDQYFSFKIEEETSIDDENSTFVAAIVTYDGQYLITAKSDGSIKVWEIHNNFAAVAVYKGNVSCLDTYWMIEEGYHLFCGNENRLIHQWELKEIEVPKPLNKPVFNALMKPLGQDDIVVRRTSENKIAVLQGNQTSWRKIAETDIINGRVETLILTTDGSKLIYEVLKDQRQEIFIFDIEKQISRRIMIFEKASNLIKSVTNLGTDVVIIFQENNNLRVWQEKASYLVEGTSEVISMHEVAENQIVTVCKNFKIEYWDVYGRGWEILYIQNYGSANSTAISSTLSSQKSFLAVLHKNRKNLVLYDIKKDLEVEPVQISVNVYHEFTLDGGITCFEFSTDDKYLAVGFETGAISILDVSEKKEIRKMSIHCSPVCELHWAPVLVKLPILLSVNSDELIWWNLEPLLTEATRRKSRMGFTAIMDNVPSPRSSFRLKNGQNNEGKLSTKANGTNGVANESQETNGNLMTPEKTDIVEFWQSKMVKKDHPGLLGLVPLPSSTAKVCVSDDFKKFLIINNTEHISIFKPFGLLDI